MDSNTLNQERPWTKEKLKLCDLSIGSTETKYIKLDTKAKNTFCYVIENLTTFLYALTGGQENKVYSKVE